MAALRKKAQIGPVGVVHQKRHPVGPAHLGNAPDVGGISQVIGAGQVDGEGGLGLFQNRLLHLGGGDGAAEIIRPRTQPFYGEIQQNSGI